jgi:putative toxin-antitoxin system antitoxin component (TIGR02293 family)
MVTVTTIAETLGGRNVLKERLADYRAVIHRARSGLPFASLAAVGSRFDIPLLTLARVIGLPARTLARRKQERRLRADESDRLLRLARVAAVAEDVLGAQDKAGRWLQKPNRALGGIVPLDLLDTDLGAEEVVTVLGRIEHGVYS